jgi:single-strand DNA-binding protein
MSDTTITVTGNVGYDPNHKVLASGAVVADFRVATTPRRYDKATEQWRDQETMWFGVTCWRSLADNVAASVRKGDRVVVTGKLTQRTYEKDGERRTVMEIDASAVGFELTRGAVLAHRPPRVERVAAEDETGSEWTTGTEADPLTGEVVAAVPDQAAA